MQFVQKLLSLKVEQEGNDSYLFLAFLKYSCLDLEGSRITRHWKDRKKFYLLIYNVFF